MRIQETSDKKKLDINNKELDKKEKLKHRSTSRNHTLLFDLRLYLGLLWGAVVGWLC